MQVHRGECATVPAMHALTPWSHGIELRWRPCLAFYEQRFVVLQLLEQRRLIRQFKVDEDAVHVRFRGSANMTLSVVDLRLDDARGMLDQALVQSVYEIVLAQLSPEARALVLRFQHIVPLDWDLGHQDARGRASQAVFGTMASDLRVTDFAVLIDGRARQEEAVYQAEFGVISQEEAPLRLSRLAGRMGEGTHPEIEAAVTRQYPPLAVFIDSRWDYSGSRQHHAQATSWAWSLSTTLSEEAAELAASVHRQITASATQQTRGD
jgi:hypothetical protein